MLSGRRQNGERVGEPAQRQARQEQIAQRSAIGRILRDRIGEDALGRDKLPLRLLEQPAFDQKGRIGPADAVEQPERIGSAIEAAVQAR